MKNLLCVLCVLFCRIIFAQDTISYSKMSTAQYKSWEEIEKNWRTEKFMPMLKKNNVKMNCASCASVYAWVVFKRDSIKTTYSLLNTKKCGDEMKGKFLLEFKKLLDTIVLPVDFINSYFKVYLGNGLKC
jgi:hypothetical protein